MNPEDIMQQQAPVMGQTPPPQMMAPPQQQAPQMTPPPEMMKYIQAKMAGMPEAPVDTDQEIGGALGKFIKSKSLLQPGHTSYAPRVKCGDVTVVSVDAGPKMDGSGQGMGMQPPVTVDGN